MYINNNIKQNNQQGIRKMKTDYQTVAEILDNNPTIELADISDVTGLGIDFIMDCEERWSRS